MSGPSAEGEFDSGGGRKCLEVGNRVQWSTVSLLVEVGTNEKHLRGP